MTDGGSLGRRRTGVLAETAGAAAAAARAVAPQVLRRLGVGAAVLAMFVGTGVAGSSIAVLRAVPLYQSTSTLLFSPVLAPGQQLAAFGSVGYLSSRVNAYLVIGESTTFQQTVRDELPDPSDRLVFDVAAQSDRLMLTVSATDTDPAGAEAAASAFARRMASEVDRFSQSTTGASGVRADVVAGPTGASNPVAPDLRVYYAVGTLGGAVLGAAVLLDLGSIRVARQRAARRRLLERVAAAGGPAPS